MLFALAYALTFAAQPGMIDSWNVPVWGDYVPGDESGFRVIAPGTRIDLWSIACEEAAVTPEAEATGEATGGATAGASMQCFPAKLRLSDSVQPISGDFVSAREEMARLHACFDVRVKKAPAAVVKAAVAHDMTPALRVVQQNDARTPTLVVVAWATMIEWQRQFEFFSAAPFANAASGAQQGTTFLPIAIPRRHPIDQVTVGILEAPGAQPVVEAIRAKKYRTALTRAKAALATALRSKDLDDATKGALRANVSSAAILTGSKRDVIADDGFDDVAVDSGTVVPLARRWAKGEVWLGPDPCS